MSIARPDGSAVELDRPPEHFAVQDLHHKFAQNDPYQIRRVAAVVLHANGWKLPQISKALGWKAPGHVLRVIRKAKIDLAEFLISGERPAFKRAKVEPSPREREENPRQLKFNFHDN